MSDVRFAARKGDFVAHDNSQYWRFAGFIATTAAAARFLAFPLLFTPAGAAIFAASVVVDWAISGFVQDSIDSIAMAHPTDRVPWITEGSDNVFVNGREAVRQELDFVGCERHGRKRIEQGSSWVNINRKPAARWKDRTACSGGAFLTKNPGIPPENVLFGGPPTDYANQLPVHSLAEGLWQVFKGSGGFGAATEEAVSFGIGWGLDRATQ